MFKYVMIYLKLTSVIVVLLVLIYFININLSVNLVLIDNVIYAKKNLHRKKC
jgi:hypothetical protein